MGVLPTFLYRGSMSGSFADPQILSHSFDDPHILSLKFSALNIVAYFGLPLLYNFVEYHKYKLIVLQL